MSPNPLAVTLELDELRDARAKAEKVAEAAGRSRTVGLVAILIGLLLLVGGYYGWAIFLGLAGILTVLTQAGKRSAAQKQVDELDGKIKAIRARLG